MNPIDLIISDPPTFNAFRVETTRIQLNQPVELVGRLDHGQLLKHLFFEYDVQRSPDDQKTVLLYQSVTIKLPEHIAPILAVEIVGYFRELDGVSVPDPILNHWARFSGYYILLPFMRQLVHSLSAHLIEDRPVLIPMYTIPTKAEIIQIMQEESASESTETGS